MGTKRFPSHLPSGCRRVVARIPTEVEQRDDTLNNPGFLRSLYQVHRFIGIELLHQAFPVTIYCESTDIHLLCNLRGGKSFRQVSEHLLLSTSHARHLVKLLIGERGENALCLLSKVNPALVDLVDGLFNLLCRCAL